MSVSSNAVGASTVAPRDGRPLAAAMGAVLLTGALVTALLASASPVSATTPVASVVLGTAGSYSMLGGTGVSNTGPTTLSGDLGVSPGTSVTGFGVAGGTVAASTHLNDAAAVQAQSDLLTAYNDAAGRTPGGTFAGDQNGQTFTPGVYHTAAAFALTGTLTLDAQGDSSAVFIFQVGAALNTAAASNVRLVNGAQSSRVFWQVLGAAGTGAASTFSGTIMSLGAITIGNLAVVNGRGLSRVLITLAANTVTTPAVAGTLSITVPNTSTSLGTLPNTLGGGSISAHLGEVRVDDERNAAAGAGWVASVVSTAFTGPGAPIPASAVGYVAGTITNVGTASYTANDPGNLSGVAPAVTATAVTGNNSATWDPTIMVAVPGSTTPGVYTATITHSVL